VQTTSGAAPTACAGTFARAVWLPRICLLSRGEKNGGAHPPRAQHHLQALWDASPDWPCLCCG